MDYGISKEVSFSYEEALQKVVDALKKEGFGVLTEIDVKETLKKKLNVDFKKYKILGACNPVSAHRALQLEKEVGLLLPCNVIVYEKDGKTIVSAVDPVSMMSVVNNEELKNLAGGVREKLSRVIESL